MTNLRKEKFNLPLEEFERKYNNNQTLIKDLVHSFLIPNVQRSKLKKQSNFFVPIIDKHSSHPSIYFNE